MRLRGARRFQMGGFNPALAAAPTGVNPQPGITPGAPSISPFQASAPAAGLGAAAAPGLNPAAIQAALAQRRMQALPGGGLQGGPPAANPLAQQLAARGAMPTPAAGTGPAATFPAAPPMAPPVMGLGATGGPAATLAGAPAGMTAPQMQALATRAAAAPPAMGVPAAALQGMPGFMPPTPVPGVSGMAEGGVVARQWGDTDRMGPVRRARGGRVPKFDSTAPVEGNLPTSQAGKKMAKGGVLRRRPTRSRMVMPPPVGSDTALPPPVPGLPAPGPAAAAVPPVPAGPPPGMRRGGRWKADAGPFAPKKSGGVSRRRPKAREGLHGVRRSASDPAGPDTQWKRPGTGGRNPGRMAKGGAVGGRLRSKSDLAGPDTQYERTDPGERFAEGGRWIAGAIKHPGALRRQLGAKAGEPIPAKKLAKAAQAGGKLGQRARLAQTLKKMRKAKGGKCEDKDRDGMRKGGECKMAAGGAVKQRRGFPNTIPPPRPQRLAGGGKVRGGGAAERGLRFSGVY